MTKFPIPKDLFPTHSPEVVQAKMKALEEKRMRDFSKFLSDLERSVK